jgi:hypothetical protein
LDTDLTDQGGSAKAFFKGELINELLEHLDAQLRKNFFSTE